MKTAKEWVDGTGRCNCDRCLDVMGKLIAGVRAEVVEALAVKFEGDSKMIVRSNATVADVIRKWWRIQQRKVNDAD